MNIIELKGEVEHLRMVLEKLNSFGKLGVLVIVFWALLTVIIGVWCCLSEGKQNLYKVKAKQWRRQLWGALMDSKFVPLLFSLHQSLLQSSSPYRVVNQGYNSWKFQPWNNEMIKPMLLPKRSPLVPFDHHRSQALLKMHSTHVSTQVLDSFEPQNHPAWCWKAAAVVLGNSLLRPRKLTQDAFLFPLLAKKPPDIFASIGLRCLDSLPLSPEYARHLIHFFSHAGMPLGFVVAMLELHGFNCSLVTALGNDELAGDKDRKEGFLEQLDECFPNSKDTVKKRLLVSFCRKSMGQYGSGHFAPVAAYNRDEQRVLLLEVNSYRYQHVWAPVDLLWRAMSTKTGFGYSRGYSTVSLKSDVDVHQQANRTIRVHK